MATTLGGTTLPPPAGGTEGCTVRLLGQGGQLEMASGSMVIDCTGVARLAFSLFWPGETEVDFTTINTKAIITNATQVFSPPDVATEYTVIIRPNAYRYETFEIGTSEPYYKIWLELEEVTAD